MFFAPPRCDADDTADPFTNILHNLQVFHPPLGHWEFRVEYWKMVGLGWPLLPWNSILKCQAERFYNKSAKGHIIDMNGD